MTGFSVEADFEKAVITELQRNGWSDKVLMHPTEQDLIQNWADILFENNRGIDQLNGCPLIPEEMDELLEQITALRTPLALNEFINGTYVSLTRKNPADQLHYGKEVSLKIYSRSEIAGGQSRYQIAEQPEFGHHDAIYHTRRGDLMLLINGLPVFHIELKRSGVPYEEACRQIEIYAHEGIFTGLFSLIQIFVAMNPEDGVYFANPGPDGKFNPDFFFHWEDFNNEPFHNWKDIVSNLLCIPQAHEMIGYYSVPDKSDGILKVMRSYQYWAATKISDRVTANEKHWGDGNQLGGYIWHTTGSGKTMTSFKSAQLIADSHDADKVVFLMDRIELGVQSVREYRGFADSADQVQDTENTYKLIEKLTSNNPNDSLIVTSIQKMSRLKEDAGGMLREKDLENIRRKRVVFIVDECHRSTFGDMLSTIKYTFPNALFFGFTGTPVFTENSRKQLTTADIFGNELHRYSIADGIRDKNVLGFDPTMVMVYPDKELRKMVALEQAHASTVDEALKDPKKKAIYYKFMSSAEVPMAGDGERKGIEDYVDSSAWRSEKYQEAVVDNIAGDRDSMSHGYLLHAIFATSSIPEAISYYRLFKKHAPQLRVTCIFDPTIDNAGGETSILKDDGIREMLIDYNDRYNQNFDMAHYDGFKRDVAARIAHKSPYIRMKPEQQLDMMIVVNQMLTGFDSKWINTLYLDKVLEYQNLIQAFSRTNRLFDQHEKPFGSIRYYRMPHTMKRNIEEAVKLYSGDKPRGLFADHLPDNIRHMNVTFQDIVRIFKSAGIPDMDRLPDDVPSKAKFAKLFREFSGYLQAATIQGFSWDKKVYSARIDADDPTEDTVTVEPGREEYLTLLQRYKELGGGNGDDDNGEGGEITFAIDPYLTELSTGTIDNEYMNSRFEKWKKQLTQPNVDPAELEQSLADLHKAFSTLSQEEQKFAELFLHDVQTGDVELEDGKPFRSYIVDYMNTEKKNEVHRLHECLGVDENLVMDLLDRHVTKDTINQYGRFDELRDSVVLENAEAYFAVVDGERRPPFIVRNEADKLLMDFILSGGKMI